MNCYSERERNSAMCMMRLMCGTMCLVMPGKQHDRTFLSL